MGNIGGFDVVFSALVLVLLAWYLRNCSKRGDFEGFPRWFVPTLIGYHLVISGVSYCYIMQFGGDSAAYWSLTADTSQNAGQWMDYWGPNTFFVQWLNYFPAKILKLSYLTGCLVYSCLGALGFVWLVVLARPGYLSAAKHSGYFSMSFLLLFFLPGPHFWTGIVGKEALVWFFLLLAIRATKAGRLVLFALGMGMLVWIRPLAGFVSLGVLVGYAVGGTSISYRQKLGLVAFSLVAGILCLSVLLTITHIGEWSLQSLREFSEGQYRFLENYQPATLVPMGDYSLFHRLFTVGFRPHLGEIPTFWGFFSGLENSVLLVLSLGLIPALGCSSGENRMFFPLLALFAGIVMYLSSIALSVNVLGIMIRLKSSVIPFLAIFGWYGWFLLFCKRDNPKPI